MVILVWSNKPKAEGLNQQNDLFYVLLCSIRAMKWNDNNSIDIFWPSLNDLVHSFSVCVYIINLFDVIPATDKWWQTYSIRSPYHAHCKTCLSANIYMQAFLPTYSF